MDIRYSQYWFSYFVFWKIIDYNRYLVSSKFPSLLILSKSLIRSDILVVIEDFILLSIKGKDYS